MNSELKPKEVGGNRLINKTRQYNNMYIKLFANQTNLLCHVFTPLVYFVAENL